MPKKGLKFVSEFLIPSLNDERFGDRLKWLDKEKEIFQIDWCHKGGPRWTEQEAQVFVEWDKHKGHYQPQDKSYYTKSKQRFRSLLYKLTLQRRIITMKSDNKFIKVYSIGERGKWRRKSTTSSESSESMLSDEGDEVSVLDSDGWCQEIFDDCAINSHEDHCYSRLKVAEADTEIDVSKFNFDDRLSSSLPYRSDDSPEKEVLVKLNYNNSDPNSANFLASERVTHVDVYDSSKHETFKAPDELHNIHDNHTTFYSWTCEENKSTWDLMVAEMNANNNNCGLLDMSCLNFNLTATGITVSDLLNWMNGGDTGNDGYEVDSP